ncbi:hypothetical protein OKA05_24185 [Luteolibacter arcticus]|uniref:Uncharacterized protein n=1 Tax=Luteolibacter arcticus TaxID=1581411 RepID=A0ABT3GQ83_9BACT|nr:hypothetical protein [Luteolibacter arcticus]MCW1925679.1 hypothetical protein [Luteolibacter arcticus]
MPSLPWKVGGRQGIARACSRSRGVRNVAKIRFDTNEIIATNQIDPQDASKGTDPSKEALVTLDDGPPTGSVLPLPPSSEETQIDVRWAGDDRGGVGINSFDVYVSVDGQAFTLWLDDTTLTHAIYPGYFGQHLAFHAVAVDFLGQQQLQALAPGGQTSTTIVNDDYLGWRGGSFGGAVGNPAMRNSLWGDDADPDGDGVSNLFEFLSATDPLQGDAGLAGSLRVQNGKAIFSHRQTPVTNHLVDHYVEWSPDLHRWYTGGILYNLVQDGGDHLKLDAHITTHGMKRAFFRRVATRRVIYAHWIYEEGATFQGRGGDVDPNGDGIPNAIAYAFGLPGMGAVPAADSQRLPKGILTQAMVGAEDGAEVLEKRAGLEFLLPAPGPEDVVLIVESSPSLLLNSWREAARKVGRQGWTIVDPLKTRIASIPSGTTTRHSVAEPLEARRFYRVRAIIQE